MMVQKDLERVGIPYVAADGIADFHASGRHTHITQLTRDRASLIEASKLARHLGINMTMPYVHVVLDGQAAAVAGYLGSAWVARRASPNVFRRRWPP